MKMRLSLTCLLALFLFDDDTEAAFIAGGITKKHYTPAFVAAGVSQRSVVAVFATVATAGFIETELRGAAMKLHTKSQAQEGQAKETKREPYTPSHDDYLAFLVDSLKVYEAFEEVVDEIAELAVFRNTGLERTEALRVDIDFMVNEYKLKRPQAGRCGLEYAEEIRRLGREGSIPELLCHYYNFYFAHTAGGRMIGKQMSALLLEKRTLEFYKWEGDLNQIKNRVKKSIETMVASWTQEQKDACVAATADAFRGGGGINEYLMVGKKNCS